MRESFSPRVIVVSSPSGGGKTSVVSEVIKSLSGLTRAITHTTRKPRNGERHGVDYYFADNDEFKQKIRNGDFVEYANVYEHYYGTTFSEIDRILAKKHHCVLVIDVQGAASLRKLNRYNLYSVFFKAPSKEIIVKRLKSRGTESKHALDIRIATYDNELEQAKFFDTVIINDSLDSAIDKFANVVTRLIKPPPPM